MNKNTPAEIAQEDKNNESTQMVFRIDRATKEAFIRKANAEGRNASVLLKSFVESYIAGDAVEVSESSIREDVERLKQQVKMLESSLLGKLAA